MGKEEEVRTESREGKEGEGRVVLPLVQVTGEVKGVEGRVRGAGLVLCPLSVATFFFK